MAKEIRQYGDSERKVTPDNKPKATTEEVDNFHTNSDVDLRAEAQHHTLGSSPTQASPGNHNHDGGNSPLILEGRVISGAKGSTAYFNSINALFVRLGAEDTTT